jgi:hypothetical protein
MDAQELRNLQEAYLEVYSSPEEIDEGMTMNDFKVNRRRLIGEQVDFYDIILSYLLDEGYANTLESAEVILENMSKDWRESIMEEKKSLPIKKMKEKENKLEDKINKIHPGVGASAFDVKNRKERNDLLKKINRQDTIRATRKSISKRGGKAPRTMEDMRMGSYSLKITPISSKYYKPYPYN